MHRIWPLIRIPGHTLVSCNIDWGNRVFITPEVLFTSCRIEEQKAKDIIRNETNHHTDRKRQEANDDSNAPVRSIKGNNLESSTAKLHNNDLAKHTDKEDANKELVGEDVGEDVDVAIDSTAAVDGISTWILGLNTV